MCSKQICAFIGSLLLHFLCVVYSLILYQFISDALPCSAHTHLYISERKNYWTLSVEFIAKMFSSLLFHGFLVAFLWFSLFFFFCKRKNHEYFCDATHFAVYRHQSIRVKNILKQLCFGNPNTTSDTATANKYR